ncbi:MAG: ribonuclease P protein component [Bacteroidetes bacterium]|nr:ribonuclease P protein component [Bacteroidota bacterium]MBP6401215.1 ribonuclease P protein component [Bacteroidia bacterium]MBK6836832.1 ribonuclease P protein component [Bacteroidota bacterium]MBK9523754.1 ribonuclease P protein component [Bacteroidota bacterium]MBK9541506.1 ribonuclease P protein component [Bacteroidota bacterium]
MNGVVPSVNRLTFRKPERLVSRKIIEQLVEKGKSFQIAPFRLIWMVHNLQVANPVQVAFTAPKRNFKSAVERNKIKRLMKEVYRKNKAGLYSFVKDKHVQVALLIVYTGKVIPKYSEVEVKLTLTLQRFVEDFQKHSV